MQFCSEANPQKCNYHGPMILDVGQNHRKMKFINLLFAYFIISVNFLLGSEDNYLGKPAALWLLFRSNEIKSEVKYFYIAAILNDDFSLRAFYGRTKNGNWSSLKEFVSADGSKFFYRNIEKYFALINLKEMALDVSGAEFGKAVKIEGIDLNPNATIKDLPNKRLTQKEKTLILHVYLNGIEEIKREDSIYKIIESFQQKDQEIKIEPVP
jgi:hypothetical protein